MKLRGSWELMSWVLAMQLLSSGPGSDPRSGPAPPVGATTVGSMRRTSGAICFCSLLCSFARLCRRGRFFRVSFLCFGLLCFDHGHRAVFFAERLVGHAPDIGFGYGLDLADIAKDLAPVSK